MKEKELKRLGRAELLELLLTQTKETERLTAELEKAEAELADKRLRVERCGSLAEAALDINGVFEAAQAAAGQYLENITAMEKEARARCEVMLAAAETQAAEIRRKAEAEAAAILRRAEAEAEQAVPESVPDEVLIEEIYELLGKKD